MRRRFLAIWLVAFLSIVALGCTRSQRPVTPDGSATVTGRLVSLKDDRPVDGGVDLVIATENGMRQTLRVGSIFIAGPREEIAALHRVVDAARVGDRLRASGTRDESGVLAVERLEILR
jgi:hypothetical protein